MINISYVYSLFFTARAIIVTAPEDLAVAPGENVTFTCVASGQRTPDVSWFQINNNSLILIDSESETVSDNGIITSTLLIRNVMATDFGNYFCMASNEFSIARANFTLSQAGELSWYCYVYICTCIYDCKLVHISHFTY